VREKTGWIEQEQKPKEQIREEWGRIQFCHIIPADTSEKEILVFSIFLSLLGQL
jgi:hypothetical protein